MNIDKCDRDQLLSHYENAIITRKFPDSDKIISLRAKLGEPFESSPLRDAEHNIRKRIGAAYAVISLGLHRLNADVINSIFINIISSTALENINSLRDWNESLDDKILNKILEEESKKNLEQMMNTLALKKSANTKTGAKISDCTIL